MTIDYIFEFNSFKPMDFLGVGKNNRTYSTRYCGRAYYITDREKCPVCLETLFHDEESAERFLKRDNV